MKRTPPDPNRIYGTFENYCENVQPGAAQTRRDIAKEAWKASERSAFEMAASLAEDYGHMAFADALRALK